MLLCIVLGSETLKIWKNFQDVEKEVRKEVDNAIAQAKVRNFLLLSF